MSTKSNGVEPLKLGLQAVLALLSLAGLWFGAMGLMLGATQLFDGSPPAGVDNQSRYLSGMYLLFPFLIWWIIPSIERHAIPIRIIAAAMMCGGIGRLISLMRYGSGDDGQLISMGVEICAPLLIYWQRMVALKHAAA
jgi:hypothetical protein